MTRKVTFKIDGKEITTQSGKTIMEAARENGIYIPSLCYLKDEAPTSSCRLCAVKLNGWITTACSTKVAENINVDVETKELNDMRCGIIEILFVEGNHFCSFCEKSGNCDLQALGYRYDLRVTRFLHVYPKREVDASHSKIFLDYNRCILCKRCVRGIKDEKGRKIFGFVNKGVYLKISMDNNLAEQMTKKEINEAVNICPVGAILQKGNGFHTPIGKRKYDKTMIGSDIENNANK